MTQEAADKDQATGGVGLVIIDMINDLDFKGVDELRRTAERAADAVLDLREQADRTGVPVIYVNDNHGQWRSERGEIVEHCLRQDSPGRDMVERVKPRPSDYFIVKPQFSGFYASNLAVLLPKLGVTRLVLTGIVADICVLFTAADAHMRAYALWTPRDAVAASSEQHARWALGIMEKSMGAQTCATTELSLEQ